jgi:ribonuclease G
VPGKSVPVKSVSAKFDLIVDSAPGESRAALMHGETLVELLVLRRTDPPRRGDVYLGRVTKIEKGLNAAFVEIGDGLPGFLPLSSKLRGLAEGAAVPVAIAAEAVGTKGPRLSFDPAHGDSRPARAPVCLAHETDLIAAALREFENFKFDRIVADSPACFAQLRAAIGKFMPDSENRIELHSGNASAFETFGVEEQIERALAPSLVLDSGVELHFGEVEALTAIDVDAASYVPRSKSMGAPGANLAAAPEIARQIRLRNLSGLILVDFPRMKNPQHRKRLLEVFAGALKDDSVPVHVHGFTRTGLLEITRERRRRPLSAVLLESGIAPRKNAETVAREILRAILRTSPRGALAISAAAEIVAWLEGEGRVDCVAAESALRVSLRLQSRPGLKRDRFEIVET